MNITVDAAKMHEALAFCMNCVETKTTMPILCHILIWAGKDSVRVEATDLDLAVSMTLDADVKEQGSLAVIGKPMLAQFAGRTGDAVISTTPNDRMRVKVGCSSALLVGLKASNFPDLPSHSGDPALTIEATVLAKMLKSVSFASKNTSSITQFAFVRMTCEDGLLRASASDGKRMATSTWECAGTIKPISIPSAMVSLICKYQWDAGDEVEIYDDPNCLHLVTLELRITCRHLSVNSFPDVKQVFKSTLPNVSIVQRKDLISAISAADIFTVRGPNINPALRLEFGESSVKLLAENLNCGNYESDLPCIGTSKIEIGVQPSFISEFLSSTNEESIAFLFGKALDKKYPFEMRPGDGSSESYRYLVQPLSI